MANRTYHPRGKTVHGYAVRSHPLYVTWAQMISRCYNPDAASFQNYGERGISVDPRWHHFENFAEDMGLKPYPNLTLERKNNELGYFKENCEWVTRTDQSWNRRRFKNNTTGSRGVVLKKGRFVAQFDYERQRYEIGRFDSLVAATTAREAFIGLFFRDREAALAVLSLETVRCDSTTGVRGVTPHVDGGFIARTTVNKQRLYLGYFKTLDEAARAVQLAKKG